MLNQLTVLHKDIAFKWLNQGLEVPSVSRLSALINLYNTLIRLNIGKWKGDLQRHTIRYVTISYINV